MKMARGTTARANSKNLPNQVSSSESDSCVCTGDTCRRGAGKSGTCAGDTCA